MNTKEIIDKVGGIVKRQDFDRSLCLFFINNIRTALIRKYDISKFYKKLTDIVSIDGIISLPAYKVKTIGRVEWQVDNKVMPLYRLNSYQDAMDLLGNFEIIDIPSYYVELGETIQILPVHPIGNINIYCECFPDDLVDNVSSSDVTTIEASEWLIYYGAAEYLDMLGESQTANYWRQKGDAALDMWFLYIRRNQSNDVELLYRDPFGNADILDLQPQKTNSIETDIIDLGVWS